MPPIRLTIPVELSLISLQVDDIHGRVCPACSRPMGLHQPDSGFPDRMLWTCEHCGTWFLMDLVPGGTEAVLVLLPDGDHFRKAAGR